MNTVTAKSPSHVELTVKRPNGAIEVVRHPSLIEINDKIFKQIVRDTANAGRGTVLSYVNVKKEKSRELTVNELSEMRYDRGYAAVTGAMTAGE